MDVRSVGAGGSVCVRYEGCMTAAAFCHCLPWRPDSLTINMIVSSREADDTSLCVMVHTQADLIGLAKMKCPQWGRKSRGVPGGSWHHVATRAKHASKHHRAISARASIVLHGPALEPHNLFATGLAPTEAHATREEDMHG